LSSRYKDAQILVQAVLMYKHKVRKNEPVFAPVGSREHTSSS